MSTPIPVSCNEYPWSTFLSREQRDPARELETILSSLAAIGFSGFEPALRDVDHAALVVDRAAHHGIGLPSVYVNSALHEPGLVEHSIAQVTAIAQALAPSGTRILVTNPSPIAWGAPQDKDDAQLATQAAALNRLGVELRGLGMTLAYHNHDMELRQAAREFHHMLCATDPANVGLCLDAHWIYRGAGNSQVALFDIVQLYGPRIVELHLRQSQAGVWCEAFGPGDIDYTRLAGVLYGQGIHPHLVVEQAIEPVSPHTLDAVAAHTQGLAYTRDLFAACA